MALITNEKKAKQKGKRRRATTPFDAFPFH